MIINNKLDKSFGPVGSFAGIVVFIAGLGAFYYSMYSIILVLLGAFVGFSYSSASIDIDNKRIRFTNNLLGVIKTGQWLNLSSDMKIGIKKSKNVWRSYSRGNRTLDIPDEDYRLILTDFQGKPLMTIKKTEGLNSAKSELEKICKQLELSAI